MINLKNKIKSQCCSGYIPTIFMMAIMAHLMSVNIATADCVYDSINPSIANVRKTLAIMEYECGEEEVNKLLCEAYIMRATVFFLAMDEDKEKRDKLVMEDFKAAMRINLNWSGELKPNPPGLLPLLEEARTFIKDSIGGSPPPPPPPIDTHRNNWILRTGYHFMTYDSLKHAFTADVVYGNWMKDDIFLGFGAGYISLFDGFMIPLFIDFRYSISQISIPVYIFTNSGYSFRTAGKGGLLYSIGVGVEPLSINSKKISLELSYRVQESKWKSYWVFVNGHWERVDNEVSGDLKYKSLSISAGFWF